MLKRTQTTKSADVDFTWCVHVHHSHVVYVRFCFYRLHVSPEVPITAAADVIIIFVFLYAEKIRLDVLYVKSA